MNKVKISAFYRHQNILNRSSLICFDCVAAICCLAKYTRITAPCDHSAEGSSLNAIFVRKCKKFTETKLDLLLKLQWDAKGIRPVRPLRADVADVVRPL